MFKNNFAQFREQCDGAGATPFMQEPEPLQSGGSGSTYRKYSKISQLVNINQHFLLSFVNLNDIITIN